jgi:hypothetical protein
MEPRLPCCLARLLGLVDRGAQLAAQSCMESPLPGRGVWSKAQDCEQARKSDMGSTAVAVLPSRGHNQAQIITTICITPCHGGHDDDCLQR